MERELWNSVSDYIDALSGQRDAILDEVAANCVAAELPDISVTSAEGKLLMLFVKMCGAKRVLEIGTLGAYSTIWLARGLTEKGSITTLEANPKHAKVARENLKAAGLEQIVSLRVGLANESLRALVSEAAEPFDFIFIDANKDSYPEYLDWSLQLSRPGTVILADNVIRNGDVLNTTTDDPVIQGTRRFNELLATHPRLQCTFVQTVGKKGYYGFALAVVKE